MKKNGIEKITSKSLYEMLCADKYDQRPYERHSLGDEMTVVNQVMGEYWKPRFLMDDRNKTAFEFMDENAVLQTIRIEDINWISLSGLPAYALNRARNLDAYFPTLIHQYRGGVAEVSWELNPDGRYYMDDDGFGMTDDEEICIYGTIDRTGRVIKKFRGK